MWDKRSGADTYSAVGGLAAAAADAGGVVVDAYLHFEGLLHQPALFAMPQARELSFGAPSSSNLLY